jgi:hypothetical protein
VVGIALVIASGPPTGAARAVPENWAILAANNAETVRILREVDILISSHTCIVSHTIESTSGALILLNPIAVLVVGSVIRTMRGVGMAATKS